MRTPSSDPVFLLFWGFNRTAALNWLIRLLIGHKGRCHIPHQKLQADYNVEKVILSH